MDGAGGLGRDCGDVGAGGRGLGKGERIGGALECGELGAGVDHAVDNEGLGGGVAGWVTSFDPELGWSGISGVVLRRSAGGGDDAGALVDGEVAAGRFEEPVAAGFVAVFVRVGREGAVNEVAYKDKYYSINQSIDQSA